MDHVTRSSSRSASLRISVDGGVPRIRAPRDYVRLLSFAKDEARIPVSWEADILTARQKGREWSLKLGFSPSDATLIAAMISELARNIVLYARRGEIIVRTIRESARQGVEIVAEDEGPGIPDVGAALEPGYSTSGGLGAGLPGIRRLVDSFDIRSRLGEGTRVAIKKWRPTADFTKEL